MSLMTLKIAPPQMPPPVSDGPPRIPAALEAPAAPTTGEPRIASLRRAYEDIASGPVFIVAHRGCWAAAPEDSVASVEACIAQGIEAIEIDVRLTKDRKLVVFHDPTLKRMTGAGGRVARTTLAELRKLRLFERDGSPDQRFKRPLLTEHRIATLEELFEAARGHIMINLEIKWGDGFTFEETFAAATALAREMGIDDHVFWKIPSVEMLGLGPVEADAVLRRIDVQRLHYVAPMLVHNARPFATQLEDVASHRLETIEIVAKKLDDWAFDNGRIIGADRYRYMGVAVAPQWSAGLSDEVALADPDAAWGRLLDLGAKLIMTDRPEALAAYLKRRGLR